MIREPRTPRPLLRCLVLAVSLWGAPRARADVEPLGVAPRLDAPVTLAAGRSRRLAVAPAPGGLAVHF